MDVADSALDREALVRARALLMAPVQGEGLGQALAAAAFAAISALAFATAMVMAPPVTVTHIPL